MSVAASLSGFQTWPIPNPNANSHASSIARNPRVCTVAPRSVPLLPLPLLLPLPHFLSNATASYPLSPHSSPHAPPSASPDSPSSSVAIHGPSSAFHTENRIHTADSSASSSPLPACTPPG